MKRIAPYLIALALFCGVGIILTFMLLSPAYISQRLADGVRQATGLETQFTRAPRLELMPQVLVRIEAVTFSGPDGPLMQVPEIIIRLGVSDLLAKRFAPGAIELVRPSMELTVSPEGTGNWVPESGTVLKPDAAPPILIRDGSVAFLDERSGDRFEASRIDARLGAGDGASGINIDASFVWNNDRLQLAAWIKDAGLAATKGTPADITLQSARLNFSFSGQARLDQGIALAGQMDVEVPDLLDLAKWTGLKLPPSGAAPLRLSASGPFDSRTGRVGFRQANFRLNGLNAQGDVMLMTGKRAQLAAKLDFERLDFDNFSPDRKAAADSGWSDRKLDLSMLPAMDAQVSLSARSLQWRGIETGKAVLDLSLKAGALTAQLREAKLGNGTGSGTLSLGLADDVAKLSVKLRTQGAEAAQISRFVFGTSQISGACDLVLDATAQGESLRAMTGTLAGTGSINLQGGSVADVDIPGLMRAVASKVISGWAPVRGASTGVERLSASFTLADGIAETKDLLLQGARVKLSAAGRVDFLRGFIDMRSTPEIVAAETGTSVLPVDLITRGPWSSPKFYPDMPGVLDNPEQAYVALRAMKPRSPGATP
ncbi:MAG: AsmA family protein [Aestuariivirgaceae bacterium]|nr:AsmA family protein [Aestuariivirgaceae bacterium]